MNKIIVVVEGGVVQAVYAETDDVDVYVLDYDNLNAGDIDAAEVEQYFNKNRNEFKPVY